jgi:hypothetical protein
MWLVVNSAIKSFKTVFFKSKTHEEDTQVFKSKMQLDQL